MPEDWSQLHVLVATEDGRVWHTTRSPGGWTKFVDVLGEAGLSGLSGQAVDVACARRQTFGGATSLEDGLHVLVAFQQGAPQLLFRSAATGTWQQDTSPTLPVARRVALATTSSVAQGGNPGAQTFLQLAVVPGTGALLSDTVPDATVNGSAQPAGVLTNVEDSAGNRGEIRSAALLSDIHIDSTATELVAVSTDGRIYTTIGQTGAWNAFRELGDPGPGVRPGPVIDAGIARDSSAVNFAIVTDDGHVWLASRFNNGTWAGWRDLETITIPFAGLTITGRCRVV